MQEVLRQKERRVQRQGGMTTQAVCVCVCVCVLSRTLTRPDVSFRNTGLELCCPKGREASGVCVDKKPGTGVNKPGCRPGSTPW